MMDPVVTCGECKHWISMQGGGLGRPDEPVEPPDLLDDDGQQQYDPEVDEDNKKAPGRWGWCGLVAEHGVKAHDRFYVVDASRYHARLGCRDDFGCVEGETSA